MIRKKPEEFLNLREKEITPIVRKLNTFTKKVREDIEKKRISESDGEMLILKVAIRISMLTDI